MPVPPDGWEDGEKDTQAGSPLSGAETPGAQWLPWIHSWSLFAALSVCLLNASVQACAWVYFGGLELGH